MPIFFIMRQNRKLDGFKLFSVLLGIASLMLSMRVHACECNFQKAKKPGPMAAYSG